MLNKLFYNRPSVLFVLIALVFGLLFVFITPVNSVPDESGHFLRSYQISELKIISKINNNRIGDSLPGNFTSLMNNWQIKYHCVIKQKEQNRNTFYDFRYQAVFSPASYLPQAIGISIAKWFTSSNIPIYYLGRIFNLLFFIGLLYFTLKIIPIYKWLFFALALNPMTLYLAGSYSADTPAIGLSYFTIAYILFLAFSNEKEKLTRKDYVILFLSLSFLALIKNAYFLIGFFILIIPESKFGSRKNKILSIFSITILSIGLNYLWMLQIHEILPLYMSTKTNPDVQLNFILHNPFEFISILIRSLNAYLFGWWIPSAIGNFGNLGLLLPAKMTSLYAIVFFILALIGANKEIRFSFFQKGVSIFIFISIFVVINIMLFLSWMTVGSIIMAGSFQGRYFLPILPLFLFVFYNNYRINFNHKNISKYIILWFILSEIILTYYFNSKNNYFLFLSFCPLIYLYFQDGFKSLNIEKNYKFYSMGFNFLFIGLSWFLVNKDMRTISFIPEIISILILHGIINFLFFLNKIKITKNILSYQLFLISICVFLNIYSIYFIHNFKK